MTPLPPPLRRAQLDALLAFLPIFAQPGYIFGEWHAEMLRRLQQIRETMAAT
ncbi:hypothetical protein EYB53_024685 [Candidatus Chloroploca sp. M-50]|uniref:Uncharacterized protein n=1 Tax=Candidatus Chloroploca mongolica TaxID=2528176 RepID=A0ABS4DHQ1_9CHLR|nr:hypothetical protein [Candidatus Chloroploca mongolica]MBP1468929.1 hypothetical protein [Candidatus Chloroploca mongolica]